MRCLRSCCCSLLCACILFGLSSVGAYALDDEQSYLNDMPVDLYVMNDGVMTLEDITGYQVLTYFQGRGSSDKVWFTDNLRLDSVFREGYLVIQITLPSGAYLEKNSTFDVFINYDMSPVSSVTGKAVLYGPNYVSAGTDPVVEVNTTTNTIQINDAYNDKAKLSVIEIWLTLSGMEYYEMNPNEIFYINTTMFNFEQGMTWETWRSSSFNNLSDYGITMYFSNGDVVLEVPNSGSLYSLKSSTSVIQKKTDLITNSHYYVNDVIPLSSIEYWFDFSIKSINISTMDSTEIEGGILAWIKSIFNSIASLPQNIASKISGFFIELGNKITALGQSILDGIRSLFIPSEESITDLKEDFEEILADRFGAVYESAEVIDNFASAFFNNGQAASVAENSGTIHFPELTVDLVGTPFTFGGWDVDIIPDRFNSIVNLLKVLIDIVCTFAFVDALRKKLEAILN